MERTYYALNLDLEMHWHCEDNDHIWASYLSESFVMRLQLSALMELYFLYTKKKLYAASRRGLLFSLASVSAFCDLHKGLWLLCLSVLHFLIPQWNV